MAVEPASADPLADRLHGVQSSIADAARAAGRSPAELTTIVVTKFHGADLVRALFTLGVRDFGENRHQEASAKAAELRDLDLRWHFIGQLQSNKAAAVTEYAHLIHSIDRESVVAAVDGVAVPIEVFIQLNLTNDPGRGGVDGANLEALTDSVLAANHIRLLGLMAVAPLDEEPRRAFATVRQASERLQRLAPQASALSIGMSADYREAILEGATHLRIGTAITGNRPPHG